MLGRTLAVTLVPLALTLVVGCRQPSPNVGGETPLGQNPVADDPSLEGPSLQDLGLVALPKPTATRHGDFATSLVCAECHSAAPSASALRDGTGRAVGPFELWQATMMANAARDPVFRAVLSAEQAHAPEKAEAIASECMHCHTPMATVAAERAQVTASYSELLHEGSGLGALARDGVSCTLCHQLVPEGLGEPETFSGRYSVGTTNTIYGPYANPFTTPMVNRTGFTPTAGSHLERSEVCASCHVLDTTSHTGEVVHEQATYLEWKASRFGRTGAPEDACQGCHMPTLDEDGNPISTRIARRPNGGDFSGIQERMPFWRHLFVGGNTLVPALLRDNATLFGLTTPRASFDAVVESTRQQLATRTAALEILAISRSDDTLGFDVAVRNLTGHRFPSGYPARRAWLRLRVVGSGGEVLFSSGEFNSAGLLVGSDGRVLPSERPGGPLAVHLTELRSPEQVQIYESNLGGADGLPSASLLGSTRSVKDNRLLPEGWAPDAASASRLESIGTGLDPDFSAGQDTLRVVASIPEGRTPATIDVELFYQPISGRF